MEFRERSRGERRGDAGHSNLPPRAPKSLDDRRKIGVHKDVQERRRYPRNHFEISGNNLFRQGNLVLLTPATIRAALLKRLERHLWVPSFPSPNAVRIGDDVAEEILQHARSLGQNASLG